MRILFLSRLFYPHIGGVEKHVFEISQELIKKGHQVTVVTEAYDNLPIEETHKKIKIYRMLLDEKKDKKLQVWWWFFKHLPLILNADVIHCHDVFFWYLPFRFLFPLKKVFTTFHGYETVFPPEQKAIKVRKLSERLSRGNICIGKFIQTWYGTSADVISYGGMHKIISQRAKSKGQRAKPLRAVFIGRLEKDTGILFYESLIEWLQKEGVKIELDVYGAGSLQDDLKIGTYKGITHYVDETLKNYDLLFSSSYLSILDGLNHQMLVVSTYDNKLKKDYLLDTPFRDFILVGTDAKKIAKDVQKLLADKKMLTNLLGNGKEWVDRQTWEHLTDQYLTLWKK
jgi:glycosyltransferase involved in cell wall biosynthesis